MARLWGGGAGGQCKSSRRDDSDYCGKHVDEKSRSHGRIDGEIPENKRHKMKDASGAAASGACSAGTAPSIPVSQKRKHAKTISVDEKIRSGAGQEYVSARAVNPI